MPPPAQGSQFRSPVSAAAPAPPRSGRAALALVLAAGSVVFCWTGLAVVPAVLSIVLAVRADRPSAAAGERSMRSATLLLGAAGLLLSAGVGGLVLVSLVQR